MAVTACFDHIITAQPRPHQLVVFHQQCIVADAQNGLWVINLIETQFSGICENCQGSSDEMFSFILPRLVCFSNYIFQLALSLLTQKILFNYNLRIASFSFADISTNKRCSRKFNYEESED